MQKIKTVVRVMEQEKQAERSTRVCWESKSVHDQANAP